MEPVRTVLVVAALANSLLLDFLARPFVGIHMSAGILNKLPWVIPDGGRHESSCDQSRQEQVGEVLAREGLARAHRRHAEELDRTEDTLPHQRKPREGDRQVLQEQGDAVYASPMFGEMPLANAIDQFYTTDIWMHSWDLSRALGVDFDLGEERCAEVLAGMEPMEDVIRTGGQFGPRVPVPDDASAQDRFVGFIGRDPAWRA